MKRMRLFALLFACGALLSGCYELMEPVLDKGASAPLAGSFTCVDGLGSERREVFTEHKTGWFFKDYRYTGGDSSEMTLQPLDGALYVTQIKLNTGAFHAAFAEFFGDRKFVLFIANPVSKGDEINALAKKYKLNLSYAASGNVSLIGAKADVLAFLRAHDKSLLTVEMTCTRTD
jgi:hypothetical protein